MMEETLVVIVRSIISFFTLLIYTRLLGKQQMGNLSYFDYINGITIGSISGTLATDLSSKGWVHFIGLTSFVAITIVFQFVTVKSRYASKVIDSEPTIVVQDGKILEHSLSKMRIKYDELMVMLRQKSVFDITQVRYGILETDGSLSVLLASDYQSVSRKDMKLPPQETGMMTEVVVDGRVLHQNLSQRGKSLGWLKKEIKKRCPGGIKQVAFAAIMPDETLYLDLFNDNVTRETDVSDYRGPF
ncbi:DUF421 domain-containing protein [Paenibacillus sp. IB182496]|uniref:DUF421 domain-containing protein n=2 Tax=Paenibacillus sabuli TaxID=2772509 RepID=A0A927BQL6_9BACL|nr:DUF421 domain-containing protein [Paenibacillus sabuli]